MTFRSKILLAWLATLLLAPATLGLAAAPSRNVILATTTSTQDSGLLDLLIPQFEARTNFKVKTIAVGSGQALAMGEKGEADVLLVHSPEAEKKFMAGSHGLHRRLVMHNDFVIVGPAGQLQGAKTAPEALRLIASSGLLWISRGDNSGTHAQEKKLWKAINLDPEGQRWYQQTGLGMGQSLSVASEKKACTLADRGTYLSMKKNLGLVVLVEGDPTLANIYHVIEVNPDKFPKVNTLGGRAFAEFMVSNYAQDLIRKFGIEKYGSPLFFPDAGSGED
jgi:tungstate transport system substrate-binding protein